MPRVRRPPANVERVGKHKEWIVSETTAGGEQGETGGEGQSAEETETTVFKKPEAKSLKRAVPGLAVHPPPAFEPPPSSVSKPAKRPRLNKPEQETGIELIRPEPPFGLDLAEAQNGMLEAVRKLVEFVSEPFAELVAIEEAEQALHEHAVDQEEEGEEGEGEWESAATSESSKDEDMEELASMTLPRFILLYLISDQARESGNLPVEPFQKVQGISVGEMIEMDRRKWKKVKGKLRGLDEWDVVEKLDRIRKSQREKMVGGNGKGNSGRGRKQVGSAEQGEEGTEEEEMGEGTGTGTEGEGEE